MAVEIITTDGAVFALWGKPTKADLDRVVDKVERLAAQRGRPVVYIARVPPTAPAPDDAVRPYMNSLMPRFIKVCSSYHVVLEGTGFVSAIKRGVLASILQLGWRNGSFFVHDHARSVSAKVDRSVRADVESILGLAEAKGLLTAPPPEDGAPVATTRPSNRPRTDPRSSLMR